MPKLKHKMEEMGRAARPELATEEVIQQARKLLEPTPVKTGRIPKWLKTRLRKAVQDGRIKSVFSGSDRPWSDYGWVLQEAAKMASNGGCSLLLDHWGSTKFWEEELVSEPYNLDFEAIEKFAELLGLAWQLSANSWHYPGHTFRILFYPAEVERP